MVKKALYLLDNPFSVKERALAMEYMANEHSWERRVDIYEHMFMNRGFVDSEA
jgi:hypothetical protein